MSVSMNLTPPVVAYLQKVGVREHPVLSRCRAETKTMPLANMQISPEQGAFMQVLASAIRARRALEVGVFTGYSSTAVGLAMQAMHGADAELVACDISGAMIERASAYWRAAGVDPLISARIGPGADSLRALLDEGQGGHFDLMFIDADKTGYDAYYELGLQLLRPGGLMLIDNMLWSGAVADPADTSADTVALRALAAKIHADARVEATLASIGDGLSIVVRK
ncbi:MAG TPA: class I SAM-dependent methyltransferase [Caulobacteraceae bacterium]|jgi:caffeoyl-CoA O-methyltransferase